MSYDWTPLLLSFKLAAVTTLILAVIGIPFAWWLSATRTRFKPALEALVSMPLVLPPSVLGFYLLLAFSPNNFFGKFIDQWFGVRLAFSFEGLVIASVIFSLPFMVHPVQSGFQSLPASLSEAACTLGKSRFVTFLRVLLPNIKPSLLAGMVLAFAHTIGEFGVILMIGGKLPGETLTASIVIYDEVGSLHYATANFYAMVLFAVCFTILLVVFLLNKKILRAGG
ncbi:MAG: molybdate ABC transporter permease subunit [Methylobacillus sp.]|jgi:molybdate transport system permease protein|nr:molybdate ABC transporter permease subunit [Methylobacillus sp.]